MWRAAMVVVLGFIVAISGVAAERHEGSAEQIRLCVRNLSYELPRTRAAAARALAEIGGETAVEPLVERLTDADADVRLSAASALGRINKRPLLCIEQLTKLLHDRDEHVRYSAQWAIGQFAEGFLQSRASVSANSQPIGQLLASAAGVMAQTGAPETIQKRVREASDQLLHGVHGPANAKATKSPSNLDALIADLKSEDIYVQVRALARIKGVEPKNVAQLVRMLAAIREESAVEWQIPETLAEAGREIVPGLVEILRSDDEEARGLALDVLTEMRLGAEGALPQLNKILTDKDSGEDALEKAIITISKMGPAAKESMPRLAKVAVNRQLPETVRTEAIGALAAIGPDAESTLPTIKRLLKSKEESKELRIEAAEAVVKISRQPEDSFKLLMSVIEDTDDSDTVAGFAANLGGLGIHAVTAVSLMASLLEEPDVDGEVRQKLVLALGEIGPAADKAIPTLIDLLTDPEENESVQVAAAMAIGKIGPEAVSALAEQFRHPEPDVRATIARAMVAIGPKAAAAVPELVRVMTKEEEEDETRVLAAIALGKIGATAKNAMPALTKLLQDEANDDQLRAMCAIAIGGIDPAAENTLQGVLNDPSPDVKVAAAYAIVKIQRGGGPVALELLVKLLADDEAEDLAARALADIGSDAVVPLCAVIFNPASDVDLRIRCVEVLGDIGQPAVTTLIGLLDKPELSEAASEALARQSEDTVPVLLLAAESQTEFTEATRETLRELVRGYYDGLGAGDEGLTWGQAHPLAMLSDGPSMGAGASGGKKIYRLETPLAVMGKIADSVTAKGFKAVKVFYGTNRKPAATGGVSMRRMSLQAAAVAALALCLLCLWFHTPRHYLAISMSGIGLVVAAAPLALSLPQLNSRGAISADTNYGGEYSDNVEMGVCEVTIPEIHEEGDLEGPSLLRLEIKVDPERHIVLQSVQPLDQQAFFTGLEGELSQKGRNVLVFVHGFNVSFEDAARRTAQMAADLKFPGAAVFYSWPSQAHWYKYRLDEKNAELSVGQLKSFLLQVAERSQATTINLVAHSMGNRLLTEALGEIDTSARQSGTLFNQVVLAAPDIDAAIFKNRIAPAIVTKARRITLYASSKDLALYASRQFNSGDPRAGDAGDDVVVIPGIETIDASAGDCSLLGHCYYGDSVSILHDIQQLLADRPARDRQYLHAIPRGDSMYWVFEPEGIAAQPRVESSLR